MAVLESSIVPLQRLVSEAVCERGSQHPPERVGPLASRLNLLRLSAASGLLENSSVFSWKEAQESAILTSTMGHGVLVPHPI